MLDYSKTSPTAPLFFIANWKMNGDEQSAATWTQDVFEFLKHAPPSIHVGLSLPDLLIPTSCRARQNTARFFIGGQDCHFADAGAYTGFSSAKLLSHLGCDFVIVGHSERRFFENDALICEKAKAAHRHNLTPVICVGEPQDIRDAGAHLDYVGGQIETICTDLSSPFMMAYEPLWAIGTGRVPQVQDIHDMHAHIQKCVRGAGHNYDVPVIYGGSVNAGNACDIVSLPNVHGVLVGGASLQSASFLEIIQKSIV